MGNRYRAVILVFIVTVLFSCGGKKDTVLPERKTIDPSPSKVVEEFLKAQQKEDFEKAYHYAFVPYTDKDGYVTNMKNTFEEHQISILDFRLLATQIYDRTATVVIELKTRIKSPKTGALVDRTQRSQYDLGLFNDKWKVTGDNCIQNCIETEQPLGQPSK